MHAIGGCFSERVCLVVTRNKNRVHGSRTTKGVDLSQLLFHILHVRFVVCIDWVLYIYICIFIYMHPIAIAMKGYV